MAIWFVEIKDKGDKEVSRYIPVNTELQAAAGRAAASLIDLTFERIGTIAPREHFLASGVNPTALPAASTAINWTDKFPAAPSGGDGGGGGPVAATGPIVGTEEFGDLRPAFERGLSERGIGIGPGGGVQGQLADAAFQNLRSRGFLDLALNAPTGTFGADAFADPGAPTQAEIRGAAGPTFQEFARTRGLYGGAGAGDALNLLNRAVALSKGRLPGFGEADELGTRANRFTDFNTGAYSDSLAATTAGNPLTGAFLNPAQGGQAATDLARVAREAGRSRFGFASGFLPSAQQLSTSYFAQPQEGAMNFADFLRQRIFG